MNRREALKTLSFDELIAIKEVRCAEFKRFGDFTPNVNRIPDIADTYHQLIEVEDELAKRRENEGAF